MFKRILIANRGEIAVRVFRACRELDIEPVVVYSQADSEALHVQLAEQAWCIGPARSADSYLNVDAILTVAQATGCDAIHPGYGFLSENADFADACAQAGIAFIGPSGDVIRAMGNKAAARKLMVAAGVPVVPGSDGAVDTAQEAKALADSIGYPVLIKAAAGGGGRGMRRVFEPDQLIPLFEEARSESVACFGSGEMYLEKLILNPRHIEFQILADKEGHVIQLGDRDCSIQRRNQKLLEESPSKA
ncbi:biotin carboxylase N-terminal domain-containing protein, partial [uncultured Flavonifractor sp.]|uniref:biotin carboxylase N-terminal domain-containing protein n=1 Tax=uncultured Flavonifractor sp. TaxID=1193534 RepID=UPI002614E810